MALLGASLILLSLGLAGYTAGAALAGARTGRAALVESARRGVYALAALLAGAVLILEVGFLRSDFSLALVAQSSSLDTPTFFKLTALWTSQAGSLLLWVFLLALYAAIALRAARGQLVRATPYAIAVLAALAAFFLALLVFAEHPFASLSPAPADGRGLNPLLRNELNAIHPPLLYAGYVGFSVPFAFAIGSLIVRDTGVAWIRLTRRLAVTAWAFLAAGLLVGSYWGYTELGWGGYWGWDPVENAALMPWLTGTAFIHSIMVQERRGMLRIWNVSLVIATFVLALTGTLLVRSGILQSVHAFGASTLGVPFVVLIGVVVVGSVALVLRRAADLASTGRIASPLSREAIFLFNNVALVGLCFVVLWGTFFPLISEAVTGAKASVGTPWFETYTTPIALGLALLTGLGPLLAWGTTSRRGVVRAVRLPVAGALVVVVTIAVTTSAAGHPLALAMFGLVAFVVFAMIRETAAGAAAVRAASGTGWTASLLRLFARNRRRYGGYVAHVGIAVLFLGAAASSSFVARQDARLRLGETTRVGDYDVTYVKPTATLFDDPAGTGAAITLGAELRVQGGGRTWMLRPRRNYYASQDVGGLGTTGRFFDGEATSEVALDSGPSRDVWAAIEPDLTTLRRPIDVANRRFAGADPRVQAVILQALVERYRTQASPPTIRLIVFPFVVWLYVGGVIVLVGAAIALWPSRRRRQAASGGSVGPTRRRSREQERQPVAVG